MLKTTSALGNWINVLTFALFCATIAPAPGSDERFLVDYSSHPSANGWKGFDRVILDPSSSVSLPPKEEGAPAFFAYLSLVEVASHASYEKGAREGGLVLSQFGNEIWNSSIADISNPAWHEFLVKEVAAPALKKGFQGFFLDTADSIHRLPNADDPARLELYQRQVASLIVKLRTAFPKAPLILNRGFGIIDFLPKDTLDGILIESLFQTYDHGAEMYRPVPEHDTKALSAKIKAFRADKLPVYVIDYVDPSQPKLAAATAERIAALDASALITTPGLQGLVLAPAKPVARKLFVIYGSDPSLRIGDPKFVPDTNVARHFQAALEWMGYELRYHNVGEGTPAEILEADYAGILVEADISLTPADEAWYADWLQRNRAEGRKILFAGAIPFNHAKTRRKLLHDFGMRGSGDLVRSVSQVEISAKDDEVFDYEARVRPTSRGYHDLMAPPEAKLLLQLKARNSRGGTVRFDASFVADWGGVIFDPYWRFQPYSKDTLSFFDPYKFLGELWPGGAFPAPDVTTREGLRLFWAHVDGDAFATLSTTKANATCAEVVRDRILKRYPLPTTISVIEAEIRSIQDTQNPDDSPRYQQIARDIFRLPNVEAASHAFSHPFIWSPKDVGQQDFYDRRHLHLKSSHRFDEVDPRREIEGSVKYIEENLLEPGKKVQMMLWTGNCRPFAEALQICREIGIEAMNGGFTIYSPRHPQHAAIAPRVTWWGDELQVYTANQNEFVYTDDWSGPTFGGFEQVIKSFEMLESPRRMKPVNIYYHFYSAVFPGSLKALERVYDWSMEQPLHAVTASQASRITRDAVQTRICRTGPNRWLVINDGKLTTLRIPKTLGFPDLDASTNVTGFSDHESERYIQTNGAPVVEIVLGSEAPDRLYLQSSEAALKFKTFARNHCEFAANAFQPADLVFGGLQPGANFTLTYTEPGKPSVFEGLRADAEGLLTFTLPTSVEASLAPASTTATR